MTDDSLLHRQVHPIHIQQGRVTSQVFRPTPKDSKRLSVYDGDQIDAEAAWEHYTGGLGYNSVGVLSVTVRECQDEELPVHADPEPFPEHAVIDFTACSSNQIKSKAKRLKVVAEARGWQYTHRLIIICNAQAVDDSGDPPQADWTIKNSLSALVAVLVDR